METTKSKEECQDLRNNVTDLRDKINDLDNRVRRLVLWKEMERPFFQRCALCTVRFQASDVYPLHTGLEWFGLFWSV